MNNAETDFGWKPLDAPVRCIIRKPFLREDEDLAGSYFGLLNIKSENYAVILWDGEGMPALFAPSDLLIAETIWQEIVC